MPQHIDQQLERNTFFLLVCSPSNSNFSRVQIPYYCRGDTIQSKSQMLSTKTLTKIIIKRACAARQIVPLVSFFNLSPLLAIQHTYEAMLKLIVKVLVYHYLVSRNRRPPCIMYLWLNLRFRHYRKKHGGFNLIPSLLGILRP